VSDEARRQGNTSAIEALVAIAAELDLDDGPQSDVDIVQAVRSLRSERDHLRGKRHQIRKARRSCLRDIARSRRQFQALIKRYRQFGEDHLLVKWVKASHYVSSYCAHGLMLDDDDEHQRCRLRCKNYDHPCRCPCHRAGPGKPIPVTPKAGLT
jgi:hypothetical protein